MKSRHNCVVDLVGVDSYTARADIKDYPTLKKAGKTVVMAEIGPSSGHFGQFDEGRILTALIGKCAYFLQWHSWYDARVSIVDNLNSIDLMTDDSVVNLDGLQN